MPYYGTHEMVMSTLNGVGLGIDLMLHNGHGSWHTLIFVGFILFNLAARRK